MEKAERHHGYQKRQILLVVGRVTTFACRLSMGCCMLATCLVEHMPSSL